MDRDKSVLKIIKGTLPTETPPLLDRSSFRIEEIYQWRKDIISVATTLLNRDAIAKVTTLSTY